MFEKTTLAHILLFIQCLAGYFQGNERKTKFISFKKIYFLHIHSFESKRFWFCNRQNISIDPWLGKTRKFTFFSMNCKKNIKNMNWLKTLNLLERDGRRGAGQNMMYLGKSMSRCERNIFMIGKRWVVLHFHII